MEEPPGLEHPVKASPRTVKPPPPVPGGTEPGQPGFKGPPPKPAGWKPSQADIAKFGPSGQPSAGKLPPPTPEELAKYGPTGKPAWQKEPPAPWPSNIAPKPPVATQVKQGKPKPPAPLPPPPEEATPREDQRRISQATPVPKSRSESPVPEGHSGSCLLYTSPSPRDRG